MAYYITQADIENVFGTENVATWSNLDSDSTTADTDRITAAIAWAEQEINDRFRGGPYALPFSALSSGGLRPIIDWCAKLAGAWLYQSRGIDLETNPVADALLSVESSIRAYQAGQRRLDCARSGTSGMQAPQMV